MKTYCGDTFPPTPHLDTLRLIFAFCSYVWQFDHTLTSIDFASAFPNAVSDEHFYMYPPTGMNLPEGTCWKVLKAMNGTSRAPRLWHTTLEKFLISIGFTRSSMDPVFSTEQKLMRQS